MPLEQDELGLKLFKRADKLRTARNAVFDPQVQLLYQYFWPDVSDVNTDKTESTENWFNRIFDSSPVRASQTCSVGVRNWVTPSTKPWLRLTPPYNLMQGGMQATANNPRISRLAGPQGGTPADDGAQDDATRWCADTATQGLQHLQASAFYSVVQPYNRAACVAGTALMFMDEGKQTLFRFEQFKFGTFCIAENDEKIVDTVFRWFKLTVRQAAQRFGEEDLPNIMTQALKRKEYDKEFKFIHCVYPNDDYRIGALGKEGMAYASIYMHEDTKKIVSEGGFEEMPYFCLRWSRWGTENQVWGCSPAFEVMAEARQINLVTEFYDALVEQKAFPRIIVPDSITGEVEQAAGSATVVKAEDMARGVMPKEWLTEGSTEEVIEMLARKEKAINDAFFVDVFKALSQLEDKITESTYGAVAMLQGEKLDQFTGTFDQYRTEFINPLVLRMIGIMYRAGKLKDPPQSLMVAASNDPKDGKQLAAPKIEIESRVTLAFQQAEMIGVEKTLNTLAPFMETNPQIADNLDWNWLTRGLGRGNGMDERNFPKLKDTLQKQQARVQMQQQEMKLRAAEIAAKSAGALGKAPPKFQEMAGGLLDQGSQTQQTG